MTRKTTCPCCRNLGVLPDTGHREIYDPHTGATVQVPPGALVDRDTLLAMCEPCLAAVAFGKAHPHRLSPTLTGGAS